MDSHQHGPNCGCADFMFNENSDDLYSSIDLDQLECLNEFQPGSVRRIILPETMKLDKSHYVQSDIDAEVLFVIPFIETVRVRVIDVISHDQLHAPNKMKVYINVANVDFDLIESEPVQEFVLSDNVNGEFGCATKISKFDNVNKLAIYIKSSVNDPIRISYLGIKGVRTQMKRQLVNTIYELIPLPKENDPTKDTKSQNVF